MTRLFALALVAALAGCGPGPTAEFAWPMPADYPRPQVPAANPMTAAKVKLGRHLFYDPRLSGNGLQACASCHRPEHAFAEPRARTVGATGEAGRRNAPALVNVAYNATLTWAHPGLRDIETQLLLPLFGEDPVELGITGHEDEVLARLRGDTRYRRLFAAAFPGEPTVTFVKVVDALACFVRSLVSFDAPFDRYAYGGDDDAMAPAALRGMALFFSERFECHHCHGGINFTQSSTHERMPVGGLPFHNIGLYNVGGADAYPANDQGLFDVTGEPGDRGRFRAPTLRNVTVTAPYMHDGSIADLGGVLDFYAAGGRVIAAGDDVGDGRANAYRSQFVQGFAMTPGERADLLAFLAALTDGTFLAQPRHRNPVAE